MRPGLLLGLMAVVWVADIAAYFAGRGFGKHKLAPAISPGKTWEGVAGGLLAVPVMARMWKYSSRRWCVPFPGFTLLLAMAALSMVGDLFESWIKRQAGLRTAAASCPAMAACWIASTA